jgi:hypothetical protein
MVGILVYTHGWHIGGCTWIGILVDAHVDMLIEACG